jgi:hypothetical protein
MTTRTEGLLYARHAARSNTDEVGAGKFVLRHGLIRDGVAHVAGPLRGHCCTNVPAHTETGIAVNSGPRAGVPSSVLPGAA